MATTGEILFASAQTINESPWLDEPWVNPTNALTDNAQYAQVTATTFDNGDQTAVLKVYGANAALAAALPSDLQSIDGVIVRIQARADSTSVGIDLVQLLDVSRAKGGTNQSDTSQRLTTSDAVYTFGSSSNKWGLALTRAWLIDTDFGVAIGGHAYTNNSEIYIDYVSVEVYYTPAAKSTSVAEVSLASYGTPSEQTNHAIKVRARTTSGSTGVIKAALYEGTTNRSGDLTSSALTNSLANYTLAIPNASAANITDYSNLSIKFWGYDSAGNALVFEVADIYLELPEASGPATLYGVVARPFTFTKAVSATKKTFATTVAVFTFTKAVSGKRTTFSQIVSPFTFTKVVSGTKKTFGQVVAPFIFTKSVSGKLGAFGQTATVILFTKSIAASKQTFGQVVSPFVFVKNVIGSKTAFGQIIVPFTFVKDVAGWRIVFGQIVSPFTFSRIVSGVKETFGQISSPFVFVKNISGIRTVFGQILTFFTFNKSVSGQRTTFSRVDLPLIFTDQTNAHKETFGNVGLPVNLTFEVIAEVQGIRFGQTSMSLVFDKDVSGTKETFGQIENPHVFERSIQAIRTTFSQFDSPFTFIKDTLGRRETFGNSAFPINATIVVAGDTSTNVYGQVALSLVFGEQTVGYRKTFGQIVRPYIFDAELSGLLETFGSVDFQTDFIVNVNTGRVEAFSSLGVELLLALETAGIIKPTTIILNLAKAIYLGSTPVDSVYTDSQKVWP